MGTGWGRQTLRATPAGKKSNKGLAPRPVPPSCLENDSENRVSRNSPSFAVALNCGIGSSSLHLSGVLEEEMQRVADLERNPIRRPAARRQIPGCLNEVRTEVDAGHPAAEAGGEIASWPADAAAEIEHARRWLDPGGTGQFGGGEYAPEMKLIQESELSDCQRLTFRRERRLDSAGEASGRYSVRAHWCLCRS